MEFLTQSQRGFEPGLAQLITIDKMNPLTLSPRTQWLISLLEDSRKSAMDSKSVWAAFLEVGPLSVATRIGNKTECI